MAKKAVKNPIDATEKQTVESMKSNCDTTEIDTVDSEQTKTSLNNNQEQAGNNGWHEKDTLLKAFFSLKSVCKDFVNGYYYDGDEIIKEDKIEPGSTSLYFISGGRTLSLERDIFFKIKSDTLTPSGIPQIIAGIGIENQTEIDYKMSVRTIGYDGISYRDQYDLPKKDWYCVNTIVINYSNTEWKKTSLFSDIHETEENKVFRARMRPDNLNIINLKSLTPENIIKYGNGDLRLFFRIVYDIVIKDNPNDKQLFNEIKDGNFIVTHPTTTALAIKAVTGSEAYNNLIDIYKKEKNYQEGELVNMCDVLDIYMEKNKAVIESKDSVIASKDSVIASKDSVIASKDSVIADKDTRFVSYLINDNKSNDEIKEIVSDITDEFINNIRESLSNK